MKNWISLFVLSLGTWVALAQPAPRIASINPEYIQRGTTVDLTVVGDNLQGATALLFSGESGFTAVLAPARPSTNVESTKGGIGTSGDAPDPRKINFRVTASSDALLGAREIRVLTPQGVSNPVNLNMSDLPERREAGNHDSIETAQSVDWPAVVNGRINAGSEADFYKFKGTKGQVFVWDLWANRIGSPLDSSIAILDAAGKELVRNEDFVGFDSFIAFTLPADGEYFVSVRDFRFMGSGNHRYRLVGGILPYATTVYPLGGQRGQSVELSVTGHNFGPDKKVKLQIDPNAPYGVQEIRLKTPLGLSNPIQFEVGGLADVLEAEPNDANDKATMATIPAVLNGRIGTPKDKDIFKFKAPADQRLIFDVLASRYGSTLDPLLSLADGAGNILVNNDDAAGADARIEFDVKKDQEYQLIVRDLLDRGGDTYAYRLNIYSTGPSYSVRFYPDDPRLNRGGQTAIRCELNRFAGFGETVRVTMEGLPAGVVCDSLVFTPASMPNGYLTVTASKDAMLGTVPIKVVATSTINGAPLNVVGEPMDPPKPPAPDKVVKQAFLSILDQAPFSIEVVSPSLALEQEQSGGLEVFVHRQPGFNDDVKLSVEGFGAGRDAITRNFETAPLVVKSNQTVVTIPIKAMFNSEVGSRSVVVKAESGLLPAQFSKKVAATIHQLPFVIATTPSKDTQLPFDNIRTSTNTKLSLAALPPGTQSAAAESTFAVMVDRRGSFAQEIALQIEGLPEGVTATLANIPANDRVAVLKLTATDKAPAGKEFQFTITGTATHGDRTYRQKTRPATLVVTAPQTTDTTPAAAPTTAAK